MSHGKTAFRGVGVVMLVCFYWFLHSHRLIRCQALIVSAELTCERIHLRWWWGWAAWPSGTRSRCSSIWKRCCCGDSRTCRSCCLTGAGNESQSGTGPCGQSRARTPGNGLTELQEHRGGTNRKNTKRNSLMLQDFFEVSLLVGPFAFVP